MAGFGQPAAFGAPPPTNPFATATTATIAAPNAPVGFGQPSVFGAAPKTSAPTGFGFGQPASNINPGFGAPATFGVAQSKTVFGSADQGTGSWSSSTTNGGNAIANGGDNAADVHANPFGQPAQANAFSHNPFAPKTNPTTNPFASFGQTQTPPVAPTQSLSNGFGAPFSSSPASTTLNSNNGFGNTSFNSATNALGKDAKRVNGLGSKREQRSSSPAVGNHTSTTPSTQIASITAKRANKGNGFMEHLESKGLTIEKAIPDNDSKRANITPEAYKRNIEDALRRANVTPPAWPADPGNPINHKTMEAFQQTYRKYEAQVRQCLIKAGLIDDPDVRKKLEDAIDFRGICEEMCSEGERISRIAERDVKGPEKTAAPDGLTLWPSPPLMVKVFKRSAAGIEAPLPIDVRSPACLRRTVDYLIDDLLKEDANLPTIHGFLWDRTRAIRKDFIFQSAMTPAERRDQIYCLENIARLHVTALHLLSVEEVASEDFSQQQELEQLGKTLLSLMQAYDDSKGSVNENEAEFRAYHILFHAHDTAIKQKLQELDDGFWFRSRDVQTALTLVEALQDVWTRHGPLRPNMPLTTASTSFTTYFSIVQDARVSYTMACFAEVHFAEVRLHLLRSINKSYGRVRDTPKDLTASVVNDVLNFDTIEQCVSFVEDQGLEWSTDGAEEAYLVVDRNKSIPSKTIRQVCSQDIVERKRGDRLLPKVIHETVYEDAAAVKTNKRKSSNLFVPQEISRVAVPAAASPLSSFGFPGTTALKPSAVTQLKEASVLQGQSTTPKGTPAKQTAFSFPTLAPSSWLTSQDTLTAEQPSTSIFSQPSPFAVAKPAAATAPKPILKKSNDPPGAITNTFAPGPAAKFVNSPFAPTPPLQTATPFAIADPNDTSSISSQKVAWNIPGASNVTNTNTKPPLFSPVTSLSSNISAPSFSLGSAVSPQSASVQTLFANNAALPNTPTSKPASVPPAVPEPRRDLMKDFTSWIVLGDTGLLDMFQEAIVQHSLQNIYDKFQVEDGERKRKEEDEQSWVEALKFRKYNLRLKFFYRWRNVAKKLVMRRIGQTGKDAMRAYKEAKLVRSRQAQEKVVQDEKSRLKRLGVPSNYLEELAQARASKRARTDEVSVASSSRRSSVASLIDGEVPFPPSGGANGTLQNTTHDQESIADDDSLYDALVRPAKRLSMAPPQSTKRRDPLHTTRNGGVTKAVYKPRESLKMQKLRALASGKALSDNISDNSSRASSSFRHSAPYGTVETNFSRSRYSLSSPRSSQEPDAKRHSAVKSDYWRLKARGLVTMPNGHVLHENIAVPMMKSGVRYPGFGDYGLGPGASSQQRLLPDGSGDEEGLIQRGRLRVSDVVRYDGDSKNQRAIIRDDSRSRWAAVRNSIEPGGLVNGTAQHEMQLDQRHATGDDVQARPNATKKRPTHVVGDDDDDIDETIREFRAAAAALDEDTSWYREQNDKLTVGHALEY